MAGSSSPGFHPQFGVDTRKAQPFEVLRFTPTLTTGVTAVLQRSGATAQSVSVGISARIGALPTTGFWVARSFANGTMDPSTEVQLTPKPFVDYPAEPLGKLIEVSSAGVAVQQQSLSDNRIRKWIWRGYPGWNTAYLALWAIIEPLRSRYRLMAGGSPYVWLRDTESKQLRTIVTNGTTVVESYPWLRCRVLEVSRTPRGNGLVVFEETTLAFVVDDPTFNDEG